MSSHAKATPTWQRPGGEMMVNGKPDPHWISTSNPQDPWRYVQYATPLDFFLKPPAYTVLSNSNQQQRADALTRAKQVGTRGRTSTILGTELQEKLG